MLGNKKGGLFDATEVDAGFNDAENKFKKLAELFVDFVKKHKKPILIVAAVITVILAVYAAIPVISIDKTRLVNLGTTVRLDTNQTARLKFRNVSVKIKHFTNDVCPKGQTCFGSGQQSLEYEITAGDLKYVVSNLTPRAGAEYYVKTLSTDYKTYAEIAIIKS